MDHTPKSKTAVLLTAHVVQIKGIVITMMNVQVTLLVDMIIVDHLSFGPMLIVALVSYIYFITLTNSTTLLFSNVLIFSIKYSVFKNL